LPPFPYRLERLGPQCSRSRVVFTRPVWTSMLCERSGAKKSSSPRRSFRYPRRHSNRRSRGMSVGETRRSTSSIGRTIPGGYARVCRARPFRTRTGIPSADTAAIAAAAARSRRAERAPRVSVVRRSASSTSGGTASAAPERRPAYRRGATRRRRASAGASAHAVGPARHAARCSAASGRPRPARTPAQIAGATLCF
jgi:hypothetical protein